MHLTLPQISAKYVTTEIFLPPVLGTIQENPLPVVTSFICLCTSNTALNSAAYCPYTYRLYITDAWFAYMSLDIAAS
jgi:hypothetical protein